MTLIEIMVALAVVGLVLGITISQIGGTFDAHARQATREMSAIIRYLYNKAASENLTMRIVFDFEKQSYYVEATTEQFLLESDEARQKRLEAIERAKKSSTTSSTSVVPTTTVTPTSTTSGTTTPTAAPPVDTPVQRAEAKFGAVDSELLKPAQLPGGVLLKDIYTEHDPGPVSKGKAYIYVFPSGYVERSIINLHNEDDSQKRALVINPMTGDSRVYEEYRELKK